MGRKIEEIKSAIGSNCNGSGSNSKRNNSSGIYGELTTRLRILNFQAFRTLVFLWLSAKGYRQTQVLKRTASRGRRPTGGPDFLAISPYPPRTRVAIQIRHWRTPVQKRVVDEMRGWMLRLGIPQGLIVTRNTFYPGARRAARELESKPVLLWPAPRLAGSMAALGLGVERTGSRLVVANWFFRGLNEIRLGYSFKEGGTETRTARDSEPLRLRTAVGPDFGENWPDGFWRTTVILLAALLLAILFENLR